MTAATLDGYLGALERAAGEANVAEEAYRKEAMARIKAMEQERAFAFRRLNLVRSVVSALAGAKDEDEAAALGSSALLREVNWSGATESQRAVVDRFRPVVLALWRMKQADTQDETAPAAETGGPSAQQELAAFEAWYAQARGMPFLQLMETEPLELPLVEV